MSRYVLKDIFVTGFLKFNLLFGCCFTDSEQMW